ncbi:S-adenosylmethionine sensor upstream of mTORC1-like isoform X2 [Uloborus diversus]|nr:S-adenosylmethionine sensor upstream of mTORC1-like isoform X2 [Uloborus diversus]
MLKLATEVWSEKGESRIQWSYNTCIDYFFGQGLKRCLLRAARKKKIQFMKKSDILYSLNDEDLYLMPNNYENITRKLKLLDVGSCYNPFSKFSEFSCAAIDLTPATEDVLECDFLSAEVVPYSKKVDTDVNSPIVLYEASFDIVIFSLVLEYLPKPEQRAIFCYKAWQLLQENGICIIITPDSKPVNYNAKLMKKWRDGLELIGLQRIQYEKLEHLHCMAFRKILTSPTTEDLQVLPNYLCIPQDTNKNSSEEENMTINSERTDIENTTVSSHFSELPVFYNL